MRAMTGTGSRRNPSQQRCTSVIKSRALSWSRAASSLMSAPPTKARSPAPVRMTSRSAGSASNCSIVSTIEELEADPALRLVILTGAGERAFVGGADINELAALDQDSARDLITLVHRCCDGFRRLPVPVIARIDGYALGAGLELAAACDLRVASDRAQFGMPEVRVGIPSVVEAALLPQLIGYGRARRLLLTGVTIDAEEALAWALVDAV